MADSPISGVRYVHAAIRNEAMALEEIAQAAQPDLGALRQKLTFLETVSNAHTSGEEQFFFPLLDQRAEQVSAAYLLDHEDERALFAELKNLVNAAASGDEPARLARLRRQTAVLVEHLTSHINKEERLIVPLLEERTTAEEQQACVRAMIDHVPKEEMPRLFPAILKALPKEDAAAFAAMTLGEMPPPVQGMAREWAKNGVPADTWDYLSRNVPQWAG